MATTDTTTFPWAGMAPADWLRAWQSIVSASFVQPILPGWTFNINHANSTSPETEAEVVNKHSYGRQLGRISDALALLIDERPGKPKDKRYTDFLSMKEEIDVIKKKAAKARVEQIVKDLAVLKTMKDGEFERLREGLRAALK